MPVPVESIAEDLLGLAVGARDDLEVSGMLLPAERQIWLNAAESPARQRFTLATVEASRLRSQAYSVPPRRRCAASGRRTRSPSFGMCT